MSRYARFEAALTSIARLHLTRRLEPNSRPQGAEINVGGRPLLNFCSNDYLGLANHPAVIDALIDGARHHGVGSGAAALLSGYSEAHEALASALAEAAGRQRALIFSSGYLANLGLLSGLVGRDDTVVSDDLIHASLIDGIRLSRAASRRYPHRDTATLARELTAVPPGHAWVVTDTVFSMDGDIAPLPEIAQLAAAHCALVICDDAHGFGVLGDGRGTLRALGLEEDAVPLLVITFGKALGTAGAAVIGPSVLIECVLQRARTFIYDTAPPPALAHATRIALALALRDESLRQRLVANVSHFRSATEAAGIPLPDVTVPIQPLRIGDDGAALAIAADLRQRGLYVRAIRPPTVPRGTSRLRICLTAAHTTAQIDQLVAALRIHRDAFRRAQAVV